MLLDCSFSIVKPGAKVITIEPSAYALSMEEVVRLLSIVFGQISALKVVDKLALNSLTHELTAAEVTAVLEKQESGSIIRFLQRRKSVSSGALRV
jgi:hypothetical protein